MNCKPGDLAIVIRSSTPENVGKIVHVRGIFQQGQNGILSNDSGTIWWCVSEGSPLALRDALRFCPARVTECPIPDHCLRPLRPGEDVDDNDVHDTAPTSPETAVA